MSLVSHIHVTSLWHNFEFSHNCRRQFHPELKHNSLGQSFLKPNMLCFFFLSQSCLQNKIIKLENTGELTPSGCRLQPVGSASGWRDAPATLFQAGKSKRPSVAVREPLPCSPQRPLKQRDFIQACLFPCFTNSLLSASWITTLTKYMCCMQSLFQTLLFNTMKKMHYMVEKFQNILS